MCAGCEPADGISDQRASCSEAADGPGALSGLTRKAANPGPGARLAAVACYLRLGQQLSAARTARGAAEILAEAADQLLGWDACTLDLYQAETDRLIHVLIRDTVNGQRVDCEPPCQDETPSGRIRQVISQGGQLVLKEAAAAMLPDARPFGDTAQPSASILYVPIRESSKVFGVLSIHSYKRNAYDSGSLETLQGLADQCAGALERIGAQEALSESEGNYRELVERSPDAIFLHCEGKFVYVNPATLKLLGASKPEDLLGHAVLDMVAPEFKETVRRRIELVTGRNVLPPFEHNVMRSDGRRLDVEATTIPFVYQGRPAVQTIMRDVTGRKQLEHEVRQAQKMDAIGQLAGGVAHDFNNLLAVIRGNVELLLLNAPPESPELRECLKQVTTATDRAANLTRQLLAFGRKQMMQSRPLVLNEVVRDLTRMLQRIIGEHIDLQCRYADSLPYVKADAGMMEQVLVNLAINARDAMPGGGRLLITTEQVRLDPDQVRNRPEARPGEFVCLTVSDAGTGISAEHLPHIFEPFFTTKEIGKGTGLGLATVYGIVKQHQGWIEVSSPPGGGAIFKIFLPVIPPPPSSETAAATPAARRGTETLLVVEDDAAVRMITRRVLENQGYKIHEAASAREALEQWEAHRQEISLVLTDIVMPDQVSGRQLADRLRAERPSLKLVFMTGYSADAMGTDTDFFERTNSSFLQKPCSARVLLETVRGCLDAK